MRIRPLLLLVLGMVLAPLGARADDLVIRGGTVLTASHGAVAGDVLVSQGKIVAVGKVDVPAGARVIEAGGKFVMPGLIDVHSHMGVYPWTIANGNADGNEATSPLTPDVRAEDSLYLEDPAFERARAGGVTTALILPGSANLIGGEGVVVKLRSGNTLDDIRFREAPRQLKMAMGENPKRVYGSRTQFPSTRMGNFALLREAYLAAADDVAGTKSPFSEQFFFTWPFRPGHRQVLRDVMAKKVRVQVHCYTKSDILALLRVADECGFEVAAIHHALEAYKLAPELARRGVGVATFADWWGFKQEAWDAIPENAALCAKAGVHVAIKSDSSEHIQRLYHEAAKCVRHGMPEDDAIRSVTLWPATILGVERRTGSIDAGKDADLAVFSKHPFDMFARVDVTIVEGKVVYERHDRVEANRPAAPAAVAIVGARVVPVSGPPIERGTVVVRGGRIEAVGGAEIAIPADAQRIDAAGKTLIPGMIDANTHLGLVEVNADPATQDVDEHTKLVVPHVRVTDGINPFSETIKVARAGGVTTAVVAPGEENLLSGMAAIVDLDGETVKDMVVRDPFALWMTLSEGAIERARGRNEFATRMGLMAQLRELFVDVLEYKHRLERYKLELERHERGLARRARKALERAAAAAATPTAAVSATPTAKPEDEEEPPLPPEPPGRKLKLEALLPVLEGKVPVVVSVHREPDIRAAIALADEFGLKLILDHATEGYRVAGLLAERKIPVLLGPVTTQPSDFETWGAIYENAALLHKAGVKFAIQTDSAHGVRLLPFQAGIAVGYGLPAEAALRAITLDAAEILGIGADYGSIEKGKVANLVLLTGDPLQPLSRVERVFIRGREVPRTSHQTELLDRFGPAKPAEGR